MEAINAKRKKVFLSSTFLDLQSHRKEVWNLLKGFDVDIIGMEAFGARTAKPLETCIKEATEADIYIGIVSMRYGSIDPNTGKSFTQLEYEAALASKRDILIYLFDRHSGLIHPYLIDFENIEKLNQFVAVLMKNHTTDSFTNPGDLCDKINEKLLTILDVKQKTRFRLTEINCSVRKIILGGEKWIIFVGSQSGKPIELYIAQDKNFYIPDYVKSGWVIKHADTSNNDKYRYDFEFEDDYGYRVTHRGLSRGFHKATVKATKILNSLLITDAPIETVLRIIPGLEFTGIRNKEALRMGIIEALKESEIKA